MSSDVPRFTDTVADPASYLPDFKARIKTSPSGFRERVAAVVNYVEKTGLVFEPFQIAAYITAVRTKPFVILAGISGTGKTKLPRRVAEATGSEYKLRPVKPDWTDSSELLGYETLDGTFRVGFLLRAAHEAESDPGRQHFFLLDEMNLARVEHYFAEVLSVIEERYRDEDGSIASQPLVPDAPTVDGIEWGKVGLPGNLAVVGSVNMDEASQGFSRKVLDRAFALEFSDIDLDVVPALSPVASDPWSVEDWAQPILSLVDAAADDEEIEPVVEALRTINAALTQVQLQVGYRVRDEIAMFCINARTVVDSFVRRAGPAISPLDLAIAMKVLPRIQGGSGGIRRAIEELLGWARGDDGKGVFPYCFERLEVMRARLEDEGFTSYWL